MMQVFETIKSWIWNLGNMLGIDTCLQAIGPWPTLFLSILVGTLYLFAVVGLITLLAKIENIAVKVILIILALGLCAVLGYIYVDGVIAVIGRLGGLL